MIKRNDEIRMADDAILNKIYIIRNTKVMLDKDLANLYNVTTGDLNKAVKRNIKRFPEDFMFQLDNQELKNLIFQIGISSWGGTRHLPYAFTEQGVAMLSGILNSDRAISVNIQIMRIFARIRQMLADNTELRLEIEQIKKKVNNHDKNIEIVFSYLDELAEKYDKSTKEKPETKNKIGFK
ncbi:MAG: ORF6N domain-containing protein [Bacteroidia bacterium]|nr:ORF6N domain-containing protein [Bacteroidia bacterium]